MCLCAAIISLDLGSITHTVSLFFLSYTFLILSVYGNLGLKTRLSRGNEREGRKCAWPTWRAWLGLPFDMIISAILEQLGSKVYFPPFFLKHTFDFDALFMPQMTNSRVLIYYDFVKAKMNKHTNKKTNKHIKKSKSPHPIQFILLGVLLNFFKLYSLSFL